MHGDVKHVLRYTTVLFQSQAELEYQKRGSELGDTVPSVMLTPEDKLQVMLCQKDNSLTRSICQSAALPRPRVPWWFLIIAPELVKPSIVGNRPISGNTTSRFCLSSSSTSSVNITNPLSYSYRSSWSLFQKLQ